VIGLDRIGRCGYSIGATAQRDGDGVGGGADGRLGHGPARSGRAPNRHHRVVSDAARRLKLPSPVIALFFGLEGRTTRGGSRWERRQTGASQRLSLNPSQHLGVWCPSHESIVIKCVVDPLEHLEVRREALAGSAARSCRQRLQTREENPRSGRRSRRCTSCHRN